MEKQVIWILKEAEAWLPVAGLLCKHGIAEGTFCRWNAKCGGMEVSDARRRTAPEEERQRLTELVAH